MYLLRTSTVSIRSKSWDFINALWNPASWLRQMNLSTFVISKKLMLPGVPAAANPFRAAQDTLGGLGMNF